MFSISISVINVTVAGVGGPRLNKQKTTVQLAAAIINVQRQKHALSRCTEIRPKVAFSVWITQFVGCCCSV